MTKFGELPREDAILLVSDRPDGGRWLSDVLERVSSCRVIQPEEAENCKRFAAIVTEIDFRDSTQIERIRRLLSQSRDAAMPMASVLRDDSRVQQIQAAALGATYFIPPNASFSQFSKILGRLFKPVLEHAPNNVKTSQEGVDLARLEFGKLFHAATLNDAINRPDVDTATDSVIAAMADGGIRQWLEIVWAYDDRTYQHCMLVTGLAAEFANVLHFADEDQKRLVRGSLLHDLGKAKIPLTILNKPDRLTPEEFGIMRTHPQLGFELLRAQNEYEPELLEVVLRHHEMLDGSGYPDGLVGSQISDLVRLVTICDIYAALIERRPYRKPVQPSRAFVTLQDMGNKLETALVREFRRVADNAGALAAA